MINVLPKESNKGPVKGATNTVKGLENDSS